MTTDPMEHDFVIATTGSGALIVGKPEPSADGKLYISDPLSLMLQADPKRKSLKVAVNPLAIPAKIIMVYNPEFIIHSHDLEENFKNGIWNQYHAMIIQMRSGIVLTSNVPGKS